MALETRVTVTLGDLHALIEASANSRGLTIQDEVRRRLAASFKITLPDAEETRAEHARQAAIARWTAHRKGKKKDQG